MPNCHIDSMVSRLGMVTLDPRALELSQSSCKRRATRPGMGFGTNLPEDLAGTHSDGLGIFQKSGQRPLFGPFSKQLGLKFSPRMPIEPLIKKDAKPFQSGARGVWAAREY